MLHVHKVGSNHIGIMECAVGGVVCMARVDGMLRFAPHSQIWSVHLYLLCNRLVSLRMLLCTERMVWVLQRIIMASFTSLLWSR